MDITPRIRSDAQVVQECRPDGFLIGHVAWYGAVLVTPQRCLPWDAPGLAALTEGDLAGLLSAAPPLEILILGCGARMARPPAALVGALRARGTVLEPMATEAACRTFNILLSEDRRVAAALLPASA